MKYNEEFEDIYKTYRIYSVRVAFRIVKDRSTAEDISQDVFEKLYNIREKVDFSNERKLRSLIFTATVNKAKDHMRKNYVKWESCSMEGEHVIQIEDNRYHPEKSVLWMEERKYRELVLQKLHDKNPTNYDILIKVKLFGISPDDVAAEYGFTRNNVNNRIHRTKIWLDEELMRLYGKKFM